jgi:hypothetical protein
MRSLKKKYSEHGPEFLLPNPWQYLQAIGLIGQSVTYSSFTLLAASGLPQYFLHTFGVYVNVDIENQ